jgi:hypothetical protein
MEARKRIHSLMGFSFIRAGENCHRLMDAAADESHAELPLEFGRRTSLTEPFSAIRTSIFNLVGGLFSVTGISGKGSCKSICGVEVMTVG